MKFIFERTIDWYDNIIKAFCKDGNSITYYCCLLALNQVTNEKVYLCTDIEYLKGSEKLKQIIQADSFSENWQKLPTLIALKEENETFLIKAKNLRTEEFGLIKYTANYRWPKKVIWGDYPYLLDEAAKIDNWWLY